MEQNWDSRLMAMWVCPRRVTSTGLRWVAVLVLFATVAAEAKGPEPPRRIPLAQLGYLPPQANLLAGSGALSTVHFLDETHLLVTYNVRQLMKRLAECPPEDTDRMVEAVVVELPSAKTVAKTQWRVHDSGQYLWSLGRGRLLLRVRDTMTVVAPLEGFAEQPFLRSPLKVAAVIVSPERDLATVETIERPHRLETGEVLPQSVPREMEIAFYRIVRDGGTVTAQAAGQARAKGLVRIPLNAAGYLEIAQESASRWLFDYTTYTGKHLELSPFDTTCRPAATFVDEAEFVALGCRGSSDRLSIGGFNLRGEQMWQQDFSDTHAFPNYVFAPAAGRFALSRNIVAAGAGITAEFAPDSFTTQEIRVYQSYNGKQLLRAEATPVQRSGQNYDLSPEGLGFAVLHGDSVEVYRLPEPSKADVAGVKAARALAPAREAMVAVNLAARKDAAMATKVEVPIAPSVSAPDEKPALVAPSAVVPKGEDAAPVTAVADEGLGDRVRKAPTLYTLPGDKGQPGN